ncbi:arginase family protein [Pantoea sp. Ap-967]|uniref:arginase family protein n=1 Tax=Pantoea sp. Ap-967 TaxID=2608362 RepID=UPI00141E4CFE|nr:arginase family protein [Pantoea sp. Ap-967]NIE73082.1 arginase family protein [Pantoea sp. Ap-967]
MSTTQEKTLRLLFPQWQGGNNPPYYFGAQLLAWLAPAPLGPVEHVPVAEPNPAPLPLEDGIIGRNERYDGDLAVLWVDAHPDVMTPQDFQHAHAMVLGNLLGEGDGEFAGAVQRPLKPANVMYAGLQQTLPAETATLRRLGLRSAGPTALATSSEPVLQWLRDIGAKRLAIHLDLDVLDPTLFRSLLFAEPNIAAGTYDGVAQGKMNMEQVIRLLADVAAAVDVVGIGIAEHLPWDALAMKNMLARLPLLGHPQS